MSIESLREQLTKKDDQTWVVCGPEGVYWIGLCQGETHAWTIALGWPDEADIKAHKDRGWYAQRATVSWPGKQEPAPALDSALHTLAPFVHGLGKPILQDVSAEIKSLRVQLALCERSEQYWRARTSELSEWFRAQRIATDTPEAIAQLQRAQLAARVPAVPEGWALVPKQATPNMYVSCGEALTKRMREIEATGRPVFSSNEALARLAHDTLLSAAPQPAQQEQIELQAPSLSKFCQHLGTSPCNFVGVCVNCTQPAQQAANF